MSKRTPPSSADWSRELAAPIEVGKRKLRTLHDLRGHLLKLPERVHDKPAWRAATEAVLMAAENGDVKRAAETFRFAQFMHRET